MGAVTPKANVRYGAESKVTYMIILAFFSQAPSDANLSHTDVQLLCNGFDTVNVMRSSRGPKILQVRI